LLLTIRIILGWSELYLATEMVIQIEISDSQLEFNISDL